MLPDRVSRALRFELPRSVLALALDELSFWMSWARTESRSCHAHRHITLGSYSAAERLLRYLLAKKNNLGGAERCVLEVEKTLGAFPTATRVYEERHSLINFTPEGLLNRRSAISSSGELPRSR